MKSFIKIVDNNGKYSNQILTSYYQANQDQTNLPDWLMNVESMSGRKYKKFINNLISQIENPRYLEIGTWTGSTACSAMYQNNVNCHFIDNWEQFNPNKNIKELFFENVKKIPKTNFNFLELDFRKVDYNNIGKYNVYFFDGPHEEQDQYDGVVYAQSALENEFIFICDDWNWNQVREGTLQAFSDLNIHIGYSLEIRTTLDGSVPEIANQTSDWHNGYFIASCKKQ